MTIRIDVGKTLLYKNNTECIKNSSLRYPSFLIIYTTYREATSHVERSDHTSRAIVVGGRNNVNQTIKKLSTEVLRLSSAN